MTKQYTTTQIFEHMSPTTLVSWLTDLDSEPELLSTDSIELMESAMHELFALVGMEAVAMLKELDGNPILESMIARYSEDESAIEDDYEWIRTGC